MSAIEIYHIGGITSIGANWVGGVIPSETDMAVFDGTSSGGSIDLLTCLGMDVRDDFAGVLTQESDIILGNGGCVFRAGEFVGGDYDWISTGAFVQLGGIFELPHNKFQNQSTTDNLFSIDGLDAYNLDGLDSYSLHSGVELYVNDAVFFRSTGSWMLLDSLQVASTSDWGSFTWGEILHKIRSKINEPSPAFFTDEDLMEFFNSAQLHFARETKFLKREQAFIIKQRVSSPPYQYVIMPNGFLGLITVGLQSKTIAQDIEWLQKVGLAGRSVQSFQEQGYYLVDHAEIRIVRDTDITSTNLLVRYYQAPNVFSDPADLDVLTQVYDEYLDSVLLYVFMECYLKRKEYEEYGIAERKYEMAIAEGIRSEGRRHGANSQLQILR